MLVLLSLSEKLCSVATQFVSFCSKWYHQTIIELLKILTSRFGLSFVHFWFKIWKREKEQWKYHKNQDRFFKFNNSIFFLFIFLVKIKLGATIKYVVGNQKFTMDNTAQLFCGKMTSLPSFNLASQTRYKGPTLYL